jgi:hypothetical protein
MKEIWPTRMGARRSTKERRSATGRIRRGELGQPSISKGGGWEAVTPWDV